MARLLALPSLTSAVLLGLAAAHRHVVQDVAKIRLDDHQTHNKSSHGMTAAGKAAGMPNLNDFLNFVGQNPDTLKDGTCPSELGRLSSGTAGVGCKLGCHCKNGWMKKCWDGGDECNAVALLAMVAGGGDVTPSAPCVAAMVGECRTSEWFYIGAREDKKWDKQVEAARARALKEGVVESEDWGDGTYWVKFGSPPLWKEVNDFYYCQLCDKHLNDSTLEAHINSEGHRKKREWNQVPEAGTSPPPAAKSPPAASPGFASSGGPLEDWQEICDAGIRCIPCRKVIDEIHLGTEEHARKLAYWQEAERTRRFGRPPPDLPYLAWVPWDEAFPEGERCLKCLLCGKWVQDESSHVGTSQAPEGSKEHRKNLVNYPPTNEWYKANVLAVRRRWHPNAPAPAPSTRTAPTQGSSSAGSSRPATGSAWGKAPPTAAPWAKASGPASSAEQASAGDELPPGWERAETPEGRPYYYNRSTQESAWEPPRAPATPPKAPGPPGPPRQEPPLPKGWEAGTTPEGKRYFFNRSTNESVWERPRPRTETAEEDEDVVDV